MSRLARKATFAAADPAPIRWALSGLMALTGPADGPPRPLGFDLMAAVDTLIAEIETGAARLGRPMTVDPRLLTERAALTGLTRQGRTSCGGAARLVEARDGWLAVNLPRDSDRLSVPAWLGGGLDEDPWIAVARGARGRFLDDLVAEGRGLDLAVAAVGRGNRSREPVRLHRMAAGADRRRTSMAPLVIDLSALWAGPLCGQLLAAAGARVIKVESVSRPDPVRQAAPEFFDRLQAGKASVALDFRDPGDLVRLRAMLHRADVVITSARPRAFAQLGLEPEAIFAGNPGLVWVAITAQGWMGQAGNAVGFGDDVAAGAGLVAFDGAGRPLFAGDALADPLTGLAAAGGALRAMGQGGGFLVDASLGGAAGFAASFAATSDGLVFGGEDGWQVACDGRVAAVAEPRARPWRGAAAAFGADTAEVLERLR
ncbi:hypothetical protein QO010_004690 [Caulobacter ginsengisoli]|uniref:CoA transferase n=1 Tax=Caulobacter ginsengisoli TaxID=400775 RepID=A0ABU0IXZ9_9CAUL|nr:CoA transferase [Caulobacter ginsengisoli]MDQ0466893.1 hypothetical protein [Caulobacter ginsengisoli]